MYCIKLLQWARRDPKTPEHIVKVRVRSADKKYILLAVHVGVRKVSSRTPMVATSGWTRVPTSRYVRAHEPQHHNGDIRFMG